MAAANPTGGGIQRMAGTASSIQAQNMQAQQANASSTSQMSSPTKEPLNTATLCKIGQETVQDMMQKTLDIFNLLKATQLPNGMTTNMQMYQEKKAKLEELTTTMAASYKRLRFVYNTVRDNSSSLENRPVEELLPIEENGVILGDRPRINDAAKYASEEHKELIEQIRFRNRQLKEIIDHLRTIIWEINTMTSMTKT